MKALMTVVMMVLIVVLAVIPVLRVVLLNVLIKVVTRALIAVIIWLRILFVMNVPFVGSQHMWRPGCGLLALEKHEHAYAWPA
jgi:hypothetical protein